MWWKNNRYCPNVRERPFAQLPGFCSSLPFWFSIPSSNLWHPVRQAKKEHHHNQLKLPNQVNFHCKSFSKVTLSPCSHVYAFGQPRKVHALFPSIDSRTWIETKTPFLPRWLMSSAQNWHRRVLDLLNILSWSTWKRYGPLSLQWLLSKLGSPYEKLKSCNKSSCLLRAQAFRWVVRSYQPNPGKTGWLSARMAILNNETKGSWFSYHRDITNQTKNFLSLYWWSNKFWIRRNAGPNWLDQLSWELNICNQWIQKNGWIKRQRLKMATTRKLERVKTKFKFKFERFKTFMGGYCHYLV